MVWYKQLKFPKNPLDARPNTDLVGVDEQEEALHNFIKKEEVCFLNGLTGSGKTSTLHRIQRSLKGHNFIYLDAQDLPESFNLEDELKKKRSFFDKLTFRETPRKKPVLIIDEFQATDPNLILRARGKWETSKQRQIKSIIIAQISKVLNNVSDSFKERIGNRTIVMPTLDEDDMKQILDKRLYNKKTKINYADKLSDKAKELIITCSGANPRRLLEYTDMIFDFHYRRFTKINPMTRSTYTVNFHAAKEILSLHGVHVEGFIEDQGGTYRLDKTYTDNEQQVLSHLIEQGASNADQIADALSVSTASVSRTLGSLRKKKAVLGAGKKRGKKLWQVSPQLKRMEVKV